MSAEYILYKDADVTVEETVTGTESGIASATITWMVLPKNTSFDGDLDSLSTSAVVLKATGGSGVTITDGAGGVFQVAVEDSDTAAVAPGPHWVLPRVVLSGGAVLPIPKYLITIGA